MVNGIVTAHDPFYSADDAVHERCRDMSSSLLDTIITAVEILKIDDECCHQSW
jgi:hypothetical protein